MTAAASTIDPLTANTGADFVRMRVDLIDPHPKNPRRVTDDHPSLPGLAETIKNVGLVNPVTVKQVGSRCMILAGERRWRAARLAGLAEVLVRVLDVNEEQEFFILNVENLQREGLHWTEEARGIEAMVARKWDVATIAKNMGRSEQWVRLRAKVAAISPTWRAAAENPKSPYHGWPVAMLEQIARFPVEQQETLFKSGDWELQRCTSVLELSKYLDAEYLHALKAAPWDLGDAKLVSKAGACVHCPKRSSCQQQLFADAKDDRCLDSACWTAKHHAHLVARVKEIREDHPKVLLTDGESHKGSDIPKPLAKEKTVPAWEYDKASADTKGAVQVFHIAGEHAGKLQWMVKKRSGADVLRGHAKKPPKAKDTSPKAKLEAHQLLRYRAAVHQLIVELGGKEGQAWQKLKPTSLDVARPPRQVLLALVATFGCETNNGFWNPDWKELARYREMTDDALDLVVWDHVRTGFVAMLDHAKRDVKESATPAKIAGICGLQWDSFVAAARDANPLPKALEQHFDEDGKPLKGLLAKAMAKSDAPKPGRTGRPKPPAKTKATAAAAKP